MNWISPFVAEVSFFSKELTDLVGREGSFAIGVLLGATITLAVQQISSKPIIERQKVELEREKELYKQLQIRDDRINALHAEITKLSKKK